MLAKAAGVSLRSVRRILEAHQLAPHRIRTFKLSNDPKLAEKLKDIVGLYVCPPAHAVVDRGAAKGINPIGCEMIKPKTRTPSTFTLAAG